MAEHVDRLTATVLIGVGAAFDFHAGTVRQAPLWMQRHGLESITDSVANRVVSGGATSAQIQPSSSASCGARHGCGDVPTDG